MEHLAKFLGAWGRALVIMAVSVLAAITSYLRAQPVNSDSEAIRLLKQHEPTIVGLLLMLAVLAALLEFFRKLWEERHPHKDLIEWMLDDFVKKHLGDGRRTNRLTLFKQTKGYRLKLWYYLRVGRSPRDRYRSVAVKSLQWTSRYLGVYVRSSHSRNPKSTTAFYVDDAGIDTEGVAGRVWEEGKKKVSVRHLQPITRSAVRALSDEDPSSWPSNLREYAEVTSIRSLVTYRAMDAFPCFFYGCQVRGPRGKMWGILT
jgi:hypothetical protein